VRVFILILIGGLGLPHLALAQLFGGFEAGTYGLSESPTVRQPGQLRLRHNGELSVKTSDGKILQLKPGQVAWYQADGRKFVSLRNLYLRNGGLDGVNIDHAFCEQLDSGRVMVLRLEYTTGAGFGGETSVSAYVLRNGSSGAPVVVQRGTFSSGGRNFREAVQPFLAARPEFLRYLEEKRINIENLGQVLFALNHNLSFTPPSALNME